MKLDYPFHGGPRRRRELASLMVTPTQVTRAVMVAGERRTISLEAEIWDGFKEAAQATGKSIEDLSGEIFAQLPEGMPLATAIRVFVLNYFVKATDPSLVTA